MNSTNEPYDDKEYENKETKPVDEKPAEEEELKSNEKKAPQLNEETQKKVEEQIKQLTQREDPVRIFWDTQPVPKIDFYSSMKCDMTAPLEGIPFDDTKKVEHVQKDPYNLPNVLEWVNLDLNNEEELGAVYELLNQNYVEDEDNMFRFDYSREFLKWALMPPGYYKDWIFGVRVIKSGTLVAFITGIPLHIMVGEKKIKMAEINFLCVHKKMRQHRLAPVLIKEVTRRVNLRNIWQAIYTAGIMVPAPISEARYYHRSLNPKKLIESNFSSLGQNQTMSRVVKLFKLPEETTIPGLRPMKNKDIAGVHKLLNNYLKKFNVYTRYTEEDIKHIFVPRSKVIYSYVVESGKDKEKQITDFLSFYSLPSSIIKNPKHKILNAAYSFYNVAGSVSFKDLTENALILAQKEGYDVYNALDIMENESFFKDLKFSAGDGNLHYYFYNLRLNRPMKPAELGIVALAAKILKKSVKDSAKTEKESIMKKHSTFKHQKKNLEEDEELKRKRQLLESMNNKKFLLKQEFEFIQEKVRCEGIKQDSMNENMFKDELAMWVHENDEKAKKLIGLHQYNENANLPDEEANPSSNTNLISNTTSKSMHNLSKMNQSKGFSQTHYLNQTLEYFPNKSQLSVSSIRDRIGFLKEELQEVEEKIENEIHVTKQIESMLAETKRSKINFEKEVKTINSLTELQDKKFASLENFASVAWNKQKKSKKHLKTIKEEIGEISEVQNVYFQKRRDFELDQKQDIKYMEEEITKVMVALEENQRMFKQTQADIARLDRDEKEKILKLRTLDDISTFISVLSELEKKFLKSEEPEIKPIKTNSRAQISSKLNVDTKKSFLEIPGEPESSEIKSATFSRSPGRKKSMSISPSNGNFSRRSRPSFSKFLGTNENEKQEEGEDDRKIPESAKIISEFYKRHSAGVAGCVQGLIFVYKKMTVANESLKNRYEEMSNLKSNKTFYLQLTEKNLEIIKKNYENLKHTYKLMSNYDMNISPDSGMIDLKIPKLGHFFTLNSLIPIVGSELGLDHQEKLLASWEKFEFRCYYFFLELMLRFADMIYLIQEASVQSFPDLELKTNEIYRFIRDLQSDNQNNPDRKSRGIPDSPRDYISTPSSRKDAAEARSKGNSIESGEEPMNMNIERAYEKASNSLNRVPKSREYFQVNFFEKGGFVLPQINSMFKETFGNGFDQELALKFFVKMKQEKHIFFFVKPNSVALYIQTMKDCNSQPSQAQEEIVKNLNSLRETAIRCMQEQFKSFSERTEELIKLMNVAKTEVITYFKDNEYEFSHLLNDTFLRKINKPRETEYVKQIKSKITKQLENIYKPPNYRESVTSNDIKESLTGYYGGESGTNKFSDNSHKPAIHENNKDLEENNFLDSERKHFKDQDERKPAREIHRHSDIPRDNNILASRENANVIKFRRDVFEKSWALGKLRKLESKSSEFDRVDFKPNFLEENKQTVYKMTRGILKNTRILEKINPSLKVLRQKINSTTLNIDSVLTKSISRNIDSPVNSVTLPVRTTISHFRSKSSNEIKRSKTSVNQSMGKSPKAKLTSNIVKKPRDNKGKAIMSSSTTMSNTSYIRVWHQRNSSEGLRISDSSIGLPINERSLYNNTKFNIKSFDSLHGDPNNYIPTAEIIEGRNGYIFSSNDAKAMKFPSLLIEKGF